MGTLRDRLIALADANDDAMQGADWAAHKMRTVMLAAARMALEDAEKRCDAIEEQHVSSGRYVSVRADHSIWAGGQADGAAEVSRAIRALRDSLANV